MTRMLHWQTPHGWTGVDVESILMFSYEGPWDDDTPLGPSRPESALRIWMNVAGMSPIIVPGARALPVYNALRGLLDDPKLVQSKVWLPQPCDPAELPADPVPNAT